MPGVTPLLNAQFVSGGLGVDFSGVGVTGTANGTTVRTFEFVFANTNTRTLQASDLWKNIWLLGNALVTVPDNLNAALGDEINIVSYSGTTTLITSGSANIINSALTATSSSSRPLKLINVGTNVWLAVSTNTPYYNYPITDCCNNNLNGGNIWQFNTGSFSTTGTVYGNNYGGSLYDSTPGTTALSNVVKIASPELFSYEGYVTSGNFYSSVCSSLNYTYPFIFYSSGGDTATLYTSTSSIYTDSDIASVRWKTASTYLYSCDSSLDIAPGGNQLYYRSYDVIYGPSSPVCFQSGIATRFDGWCP